MIINGKHEKIVYRKLIMRIDTGRWWILCNYWQVDELKSEIAVKKPPKEKEYDLEAEMLGTGNSSARQRTAVEKHREQLRKIEKERKESQEVCKWQQT